MSTKTLGSAPDPVVARRRQRVLALFEAGMRPKQILEPVRAEFGRSVTIVAIDNDIRWLRRNGAVMQKGATWADDMDRRCLALKKAGHSYGAIAEELGISRSAVGGRLHRIAQRKQKAAQATKATPCTEGRQSRPQSSHPKSTTKPSPRRPSQAAKRRRLDDWPDMSEQSPVPAIVASQDTAYPPGAPTAVMTAKPGTCRWPIGEPRDSDFRFCGAKALDGSSWCADCAAIAWPTGGGTS